MHDPFGKTQHCDIHVCCISMAHCTLTNQQTDLCLVMLHTCHTYFTTDKAWNYTYFELVTSGSEPIFYLKHISFTLFTQLIQRASGLVYLHSYTLAHLCRPDSSYIIFMACYNIINYTCNIQCVWYSATKFTVKGGWMLYTRWFKYDWDWFVCKQAALRSSCATLREWSHNLHPPSCLG